MIDSEFERKGREMSDELNQIQPIDEVDLEYRLDAEPLPVPVCLQVKTCNGAVVMALQAENDQLRAELEKIRVALRGYADSDLASLAQTIQARNEKAEAELEQVKAERDAMGAVVASQSRNACVSGGTPTLAERALERARNQLRAELETAQDNALRAANLGAEWKERAERYKSERDAAILDARKLAQNWNGVMTSVELEAIVKKYLQH